MQWAGIGIFFSTTSALIVGKKLLSARLRQFSTSKCCRETATEPVLSAWDILADRSKTMASNVSVFYRKHGGIVVTRGNGVYMFDSLGKRYLDCCNNVACVGHSHPTVVAAGCNELGKIQTNTRFLHPARQRYLKKLLVGSVE